MNSKDHILLGYQPGLGNLNVTIDQVLAGFLNILYKGYIDAEYPLYVTYPHYFDNQALRMLKNALDIADINNVELIREDYALINGYIYQNLHRIRGP